MSPQVGWKDAFHGAVFRHSTPSDRVSFYLEQASNLGIGQGFGFLSNYYPQGGADMQAAVEKL